MQAGNSIEITNLKKDFRVYYDKGNMLKERILFPNRNRYEDRHILKGISFRCKKGETIGLIGHNGCGKSTILKLLSKILRPNEGTVEISGRVSSLIELGAGFHMDMSGRENIYINATIFGLKRKEIDERIEDIIRFSELAEFIDNPVRTYSSGMYMRLAFSIAINVDADVLLIDEILAVGDVSFQKKCFQRLREIKEAGTTIVIVSHSMEQLYEICDRLIWIDDGLIREEGEPKKIGENYLHEMEAQRLARVEVENAEERERIKQLQRIEEERRKKELELNHSIKELMSGTYEEARRTGLQNVCIRKVKINIKKADEVNQYVLSNQDSMEVELECLPKEPNKVNVFVDIEREDRVICYGTKLMNPPQWLLMENQCKVSLRISTVTLLPGRYFLNLKIIAETGEVCDHIQHLCIIDIHGENKGEYGVCRMEHQWKIEDDNGKVCSGGSNV